MIGVRFINQCFFSMSQYRRYYRSNSCVFLTIVTYQRQPIFENSANIELLRRVISKTKQEKSFDILAAAVLPEHLHFLWQLPEGDSDYSQRVSRLKTLFTRQLRGNNYRSNNISLSRHKHRESDVWQRRFWEHTIRDESDFHKHLDYIHYNPVKHKLVSCPHLWQYSSFHNWVKQGKYSQDWACCCHDIKST
jgi:putative transposase